MSVNPGFGGQHFIEGSLRKIESLARIRESRGLGYRIEVDGGIDLTTVADVVRAGADLLVAGNAVFGHGNIRDNVTKLLQAARATTLTRA
jgi:ribulose-phosphate 3-epimerase